MNPRSITQTATQLSSGKDLKQLALYSAGALALANLLLLLVQELIGSLLTDATGLAALGKRSLLLTVQSAFSLAVTVAIPFWTFGFYRAAMERARENRPTPDTLLHGFRRFWPLLRLLLIETLMAAGYILLATTLGTTLFMMTPIADRAFEMIIPYLQAAESITDPAALNALMEPLMLDLLQQIWPMYLLIAVALGIFLVPWLYQICLAPYHILDGQKSALLAMNQSRYEMHGNRLSWLLLDLRWWWYYVLLTLATVPLYLPDFISGKGFLWGMTLLSIALQTVIQWQFLPRVQVSYALAYDQLRHKEESEN